MHFNTILFLTNGQFFMKVKVYKIIKERKKRHEKRQTNISFLDALMILNGPSAVRDLSKKK